MVGFGNMQEISDEALVEIDKSHEWLDFSHIFGGRPVSDAGNLDWVHLYTTLQKDKTKVFNCRLFKCEFLHLEVEMVLFFGLSTEN